MRLPEAPGGKRTWIVDIEVFPDYFYAAFYNGERWKEYDHTMFEKLSNDLNNKDLVLAGFNNFAYDDLILAFIAAHPEKATTERIYQTSQDIIKNRERLREQIFAWQYADRPWAYSIDVFQLLNGKGSLKEWACRIGSPLVAETPVDFDAPLQGDRIEDVKLYCKNDVAVTKQLLLQNWNRVTLRKTLVDKFQLCGRVYCMSEQAVAQHTFLTLHRQRTGQKSAEVRKAAQDSDENHRIDFPMTEIASDSVMFATAPFRDFYTEYRKGIVRNVNDSWKIVGGPDLSKVALADREFAMGVGGIHTVDGPGYFEATDETAIVDLDVASYYPSLIIELGLSPSHMGGGFCDDMRKLRDMRLTAKRSGDTNTSDALKIVINATFGKLNDVYSPIRSVPSAHKTTVNGQLYILMLVEDLHAMGCEIVSANTDGVTVSLPRTDMGEMREVCKRWQSHTKMELEEVEYSRIFRRDVNNYIAVSVKGKVKYKGAANAESGKADLSIVKEACERYLLEDVPPSVTIQNAIDSNEWQKFISYLSTKNGAILDWGGELIGKRCRWLHTTDGKPLKRHNRETEKRKENIAMVPNCDRVSIFNDATGRIRLQDLNIDAEFYEAAAWGLIESLGVK